MDSLDNLNKGNTEIVLEEAGKLHLVTGRKWALFLAILASIGLGLMIILALFMFAFGALIGNEIGFPGWILGFVYLLLAAVYFFPVYFLFKFTSLSKKAVDENNSQYLTLALESIKGHFKSIGIVSIVLIGLYIVGIIVMASIGIAQFL